MSELKTLGHEGTEARRHEGVRSDEATKRRSDEGEAAHGGGAGFEGDGGYGKWIALGLAVLVVAVLGWMVVDRVRSAMGDTEVERGERRIAVEVSEVRVGPIREIRQFTGTLHPRSQFVVAPRVGGRLERLYVDIGDEVRRGQVVARLDSEEFEQAVQQAEAEVAVARATLAERERAFEIGEQEFSRVRQLHEEGIASAAEFDTARARLAGQQAQVNVAEAQVAQREAALRTAEIRRNYTEIAAAWEGSGDVRVVGERFMDEGATLTANERLISLLDIETLIVVIQVTDRDYARLSLGQEAIITVDSYPGREFTARIVRRSPMFREATRQARVELEAANADGLLNPGMFARIRLELGREENVTAVPVSALLRRDGRDGVFVVDEGDVARFIPVRRGIQEGQWVQIVEPVLEGRVVTLGQHLLVDNTPVAVAEGSEEGSGVQGSIASDEATKRRSDEGEEVRR